MRRPASLLQSPPVSSSLSLLTLDFSWPGLTGYCCPLLLLLLPPVTASTESTAGVGGALTPHSSLLLPSFLPSFLPTVIFRAFELKVGSRLARLKLAVSPVQGGQHLRTWPPLALQTLLSALRIVQQRLCKNFILTFSWVAGGPSCPEL